MDLNRHDIIGRAGADPTEKTTTTGSQIVRLRVATSNVQIKDGEKIETTDWHSVVFFGKLGEFCKKYVKKGTKLYISGRHSMYQYQKEGEKYPNTISEIIARDLILLSSKRSGDFNEDTNDIPF